MKLGISDHQGVFQKLIGKGHVVICDRQVA